MKIENKYNRGDKVFCVRFGRIEQIIIEGFTFESDIKLPLEQRLRYMMRINGDKLPLNFMGQISFTEEELHETIDELLDYLKTSYEKRTKTNQ